MNLMQEKNAPDLKAGCGCGGLIDFNGGKAIA